MTLMRRIILVLAIVLAPMQLAWAGQMSSDPIVTATAAAQYDQAADLAECCKDGSHQTPTCQNASALPVGQAAFGPTTRASHDSVPRPPARRIDSRADAPALRPPIPA